MTAIGTITVPGSERLFILCHIFHGFMIFVARQHLLQTTPSLSFSMLLLSQTQHMNKWKLLFGIHSVFFLSGQVLNLLEKIKKKILPS